MTCAHDEVAGDVVLEVAAPKCLSVVCSLDDPSTGVSHECRDILYQGSSVATCTEGYEADGSISTTSLRCLRRVNLSAMHKLSLRRVHRCSALTL